MARPPRPPSEPQNAGPQSEPLPYLEGYAPALVDQVRGLLAQGRLGEYLAVRYPEPHAIRTDKALGELAQELKTRFMRSSPPLRAVKYDPRLQVLRDALGLHTRTSRVQGSQLKASREIRIATVFKDAPAAFLRMILVHELAHLKEGEHSKAFYALCTHMEPAYFQLEFDLRLYLTHLERRDRP
jgi:hypothetical protein